MNSRMIAVEILEKVLEEGAYSNIALGRFLNKYDIKEQDRALITEIVYGTLKYKYTIDTILSGMLRDPLERLDKSILNILRISIYQFRYLDKVPEYAIVNEGVNLAKKTSIGASKLVNGVLRNYLRNKDGDFKIKPGLINELCFKYSFDKWMVKLFLDQYGREYTEKILNGLNSVPPVTIRINTLKSNYDDIFNKLRELNYTVEEGAVCPEAIKLIRGSSIESNPLFKEGYFTVQDESAMLASLAMEVSEGMEVLDICAAPGGKSTHMGEMMNNKGTISSIDLYEHKIKLIENNAERLGISNIKTMVTDAAVFNPNLREKFDRVLVDAPCSGLGIIRKKPEIKWVKTMDEIKGLYKIQEHILKNASSYLKKGGILVYATCTLNVEENEKRVLSFLKENKDFSIDKLFFGERDNFIYTEDGMLTILPDRDMDGFFIARLIKNV